MSTANGVRPADHAEPDAKLRVIDLRAHRAARNEQSRRPFHVPLDEETTIQISNPKGWKNSWMDLLQTDQTAFLRKIMSEDDFQVWLNDDPDLEDVEYLIGELLAKSGLGSPGESPAS